MFSTPPPAGEGELISQYPPPGEEREPIAEFPPSSRHQEARKRHTEPTEPPTVATTTPVPPAAALLGPPSHHMQTGELVFSQDPAVAKQQKELYAPGVQTELPPSSSQPRGAQYALGVQTELPPSSQPRGAQGSSEVTREVELRKKLVGRVQSFRIGRNQSSGSSQDEEVATGNNIRPPTFTADSAGRAKEEVPIGDGAGVRSVEAPPPISTPADELVVESTGEMQQDPLNEIPQPAEIPTVEPPPSINTSFQGSEARIEPETGIMEGEPGEIMDDSTAEAEEMVGVAEGGASTKGVGTQEEERGEGRVFEEGETMGGEEEEVQKMLNIPIGRKCYMDMEKGGASENKDDVAKKR